MASALDCCVERREYRWCICSNEHFPLKNPGDIDNPMQAIVVGAAIAIVKCLCIIGER